MLVLGLTGSVGMGKSTSAGMFAEAGVAVFDADRAVHALYAGPAVAAIEEAFPDTTSDGRVDRVKLGARVAGDAKAFARLEAIVHPMVREAEAAFRADAAAGGRRIMLLDIPLLFETRGEHRVDAIAVVSTTAAIQRQRVLARPGMTEERFAAILARQMPDAEKRTRAHFILDSGTGFADMKRQIADLLRAVAGMAAAR